MSIEDVSLIVIAAAAGIGLCVGVAMTIKDYRASEPEERKGVRPKIQVSVITVFTGVSGLFAGAFAAFLAVLAVAFVVGLGRAGWHELSKSDGSATNAASFQPPACDPDYSGACLDPTAPDYDCAGGTGDGPRYVEGPVRVRGSDPFGLDGNGDGIGCEF